MLAVFVIVTSVNLTILMNIVVLLQLLQSALRTVGKSM